MMLFVCYNLLSPLIYIDWHAIANVYIHAERYHSKFIVYPFFICANLVGVNILLNVLTAFFVGVRNKAYLDTHILHDVF